MRSVARSGDDMVRLNQLTILPGEVLLRSAGLVFLSAIASFSVVGTSSVAAENVTLAREIAATPWVLLLTTLEGKETAAAEIKFEVRNGVFTGALTRKAAPDLQLLNLQLDGGTLSFELPTLLG